MLALACGSLAGGLRRAAAGVRAARAKRAGFRVEGRALATNVRLSEHRGEVVVLSFWSSRCAPCGAQLAALDRSFETYQSAGLKIFGVGVDDDAARSTEFAAARSRSPFRCCSIRARESARAYQVDNLPMTVLIDRSGNVRYVHRDYSAKSDALYLDELRELLNE